MRFYAHNDVGNDWVEPFKHLDYEKMMKIKGEKLGY